MKPLIFPASTSIALVAGAIASIIVWSAKQFGGIDIPDNIRDAIIVLATALGGHFTTDAPSAPVAREAVADAAADAEMDESERIAARKQ